MPGAKKKQTNVNGLNPDKPISKEEDLLAHSQLATRIADKINDRGDDYENSIVIGIEGAWGAGKSSFINLILNKVHPNKKNLIIEFNPWNFSDRNYLIYQLFILIAEKLDQIGYDIWWDRLREKIIEVANKVNNKVSKCCKPLLRQLPRRRDAVKKIKSKELEYSGGKRDISIGTPWINLGYTSAWEASSITSIPSLEKKRDEIHKLLRERKRRTIIVIQCIDKLDRKRTEYIFDLVTFAMNTPNTIFLLSYDRNMVCERMNNESGVNFEVQLREMIKCAYSLPKLDQRNVRNMLRTIIGKLNFGDADDKRSG